MNEAEARDIANQAGTNLSAMIIDTTPKIHGYLNGTATDVSPLGIAVVLTTIGARHCGLSKENITKLLLALDEDGVFQDPQPERLMPDLDEVAAAAAQMMDRGLD